jgi:diguanylate cyclase (GGDEF)-like protein/PAS domain S-box-containing protein
VLRVLACLTTEHDYRLVLLAAVICATATLTAFHLYERAKSNRGGQRLGWLFLTGVATGAGIWATHFVAMLAFQPGLPASYEPTLTGLSLVIAVAVTTMGFAAGSFSRGLASKALGGGVIGAGIASMHYTGMKAFQIPGRIEWDSALVHSSVVIGLALSAAALIAFEKVSGKWKAWAGAGLLTLGICGLHFTAMSAAIIVPDPTVFVVPAVVDNSIMALAVASITMLVIFAGVTAVLIDSQATRESVARAQELVDATFEGLVIARDGAVHNVNRRLAELSGFSAEELMGKQVWPDLIDGKPPSFNRERERIEASLKTREGDDIPVEVVYRPYVTGRAANQVYAVRDLRERLKAEKKIRFLAHNDTLTGLPNRTSLNAHLARVLRAAQPAREPFAVMCMDLDRFKDVNDVLGHSAGDAVLTEAAQRMIKAAGDGAFLARIGGDEFIAVQSGHNQPEGIAVLASALQEAFREPFQLESQIVQLGLSAGIALYPDDGATREILLSNADTALYRAKLNGRGRACYFEPEMDELQRRRRKLAQALHSALASGQFELHYQPQVRLPTAELIGFEALVRWHHPEHGTISPADFIPIAEETGLILPIGEWVLRTACAEAAQWDEPCKVAVNLSPKQFQQSNLPGLVLRILEETGLAPSRLELEITETTLFEDHQRAIKILGELKALGVSIAMDDFGTGYSSLSTLQAFPFDRIKIDRSFVDNVECAKEAAAIVKSVLSLGRSLDIPVLAEGVETDSQLQFLAREHCQAVQGFYFGRPETSAEVRELLRSGSLLKHTLKKLKGARQEPARKREPAVVAAKSG